MNWDTLGPEGMYTNGAQGRNRTTDTAIFSRMLYQLSYLGIRTGGRPYPMPTTRSSRLVRL
jgi:hypothetical protein